MTWKKRILAIGLATMMATSLPLMNANTVFASGIATASEEKTTEGFEFAISEGTASVIGYNGTDTDVVIPAEYQGYPVTSIGDYAFFRCESLKSINIPDSVVTIGEGAFYRCSSLISINLPNGITSIKEVTFYSCSSLTNIIIPDSVTSIGESAFEYCSNLKSITIPESVTYIGWKSICSGNGLTIYCTAGSCAEQYAKIYEIPYKYIESAHVHSFKDATCTSPRKCDCGATEGNPLGHKLTTTVSKATLSTNGSIKKVCSVCKKTTSTTTIYAPETFTLSKTGYTYNGKIQKPSLTIKDSAGKTIAADNYTLTYSNSSSKNPGTYTVKVTFKGNYSGTKSLSYKIVPTTPELSAAANAAAGITVKWGKVTGADGYYVYRKTSSTSWTKIATISSGSTVSYTDKGAKAGSTYIYTVKAYSGQVVSSYDKTGKSIKCVK